MASGEAYGQNKSSDVEFYFTFESPNGGAWFVLAVTR